MRDGVAMRACITDTRLRDDEKWRGFCGGWPCQPAEAFRIGDPVCLLCVQEANKWGIRLSFQGGYLPSVAGYK